MNGDRLLNLNEVQMLAEARYDIGPTQTALVFDSTYHRSDNTVNIYKLYNKCLI